MSHKNNSTETDRESINKIPRRGRPAASAENMLMAAEQLFSQPETSSSVTMEDIAARAGVGKGTLFRAFGSREGLLDALWSRKLNLLRQSMVAVTDGPGGTPARRLSLFLDALLLFKIDNRALIRALEISPGSLLKSENYRWMVSVISGLILQTPGNQETMEAEYIAHSLLATLHIDLLETLLANDTPLAVIRRMQQRHISLWTSGKTADLPR